MYRRLRISRCSKCALGLCYIYAIFFQTDVLSICPSLYTLTYRGYTRIEDVFPIEHEDMPASYVIVYQRVVVLMFFWEVMESRKEL